MGDGTPQALTPILTGKTELELPDVRKRFAHSHPVDVYPFIWNDYQQNGYVTAFLEDLPDTGVYQYRLRGFTVRIWGNCLNFSISELFPYRKLLRIIICDPIISPFLRSIINGLGYASGRLLGIKWCWITSNKWVIYLNAIRLANVEFSVLFCL